MDTQVTTNTIDDLKDRLAKLEISLASNTSLSFDLATELKYIHSSLKANPEIALILTDEEIGTITKGFAKETNIVLNAPKAKKPAKAFKELTVDDI
jgi:hypothetical protein